MIDTKETQVNLLVYGTLKPGHYNFDRFFNETNVKVGEEIKLPGFKMYSLGAYPCVVHTENNEDIITAVKLKNVKSNIFNSINNMELGAGYVRKEIQLDNETYFIYVFRANNIHNLKVVENGNWN
jgi:gamma-glutamylcyclotransferase (GGCT)/AIG2-like uncharacterized protein YtfP